MAIALPPLPLGTQTTFALQSNARDHTPTFGGSTQRVKRLGDRWIISVNCQSMSNAQGVAVVAKLVQGLSSTVTMIVPQPGITPSPDGTVSSGSGETLIVSGTSNVKPGVFFSLVHGGVRYLHQVTGVSGSTLSIQPMLKVVPTAGDVVEFQAPKIEGFVQGNQQAWTLNLAYGLGLSFTIVEAQ